MSDRWLEGGVLLFCLTARSLGKFNKLNQGNQFRMAIFSNPTSISIPSSGTAMPYPASIEYIICTSLI
jgi:hypothetical protein